MKLNMQKFYFKFHFKNIVLAFSFFVFFSTFSQNLNSNSTGSFVYYPISGLPSVKVFYHIPQGDITSMPIIFSFHGASRNADDYRDYWISMSNSNKFMVFAPKFSDKNFPGGDVYNLGNVFDDGDNPTENEFNEFSEWTFSVIDDIFDFIVNQVSGSQERYNAWGHSGGAQFLQRFAFFVPNSKLNIGVCSNAGWYTVPESNIDFPYGIGLPFTSNDINLPDFILQNYPSYQISLNKFFQRELVIHLGTDDNDSNSSGLRHNNVVDSQQGNNRYDRGNYFFSTSNSISNQLLLPFNWIKSEIAGVGHQAQLMANDALKFIVKESLTNDYKIKDLDFVIYPNPVQTKVNFLGLTSPVKVTVYDILGKRQLQSEVINSLDVSKLRPGLYVVEIKNENITKSFNILKR
jgi:hypothetical protein